jgi:hypothetical protein
VKTGKIMEDLADFIAIGDEELAKAKPIGKTVKCWICGKRHEVKYGERILEDGTREPTNVLAFYNCSGHTYLCGLKGKEFRPKGK